MFVDAARDGAFFRLGGFSRTLGIRTAVPKVQPLSHMGAEVLVMAWGLRPILNVGWPVAHLFLDNAAAAFMLLCFRAPVGNLPYRRRGSKGKHKLKPEVHSRCRMPAAIARRHEGGRLKLQRKLHTVLTGCLCAASSRASRLGFTWASWPFSFPLWLFFSFDLRRELYTQSE